MTKGISPKVYLPFAATEVGAVGAFIAEGKFGTATVALFVTGLVQAVLGFLANPGAVE